MRNNGTYSLFEVTYCTIILNRFPNNKRRSKKRKTGGYLWRYSHCLKLSISKRHGQEGQRSCCPAAIMRATTVIVMCDCSFLLRGLRSTSSNSGFSEKSNSGQKDCHKEASKRNTESKDGPNIRLALIRRDSPVSYNTVVESIILYA